MVVIPILILLAMVVVLSLLWNGRSALKESRGDSSMDYLGDTTASDHTHSDHCGHGHDGGGDGGGDCGGGDGGGGSD